MLLLSDTKLNIMHHCKHLKNIFLTIGTQQKQLLYISHVFNTPTKRWWKKDLHTNKLAIKLRKKKYMKNILYI